MRRLLFSALLLTQAISYFEPASSLTLSECYGFPQNVKEKVQRKEKNPASVYVDGETMTLKHEIDRDADVYGFFNDELLSTGWGVLEFKAGYGAGSRRLPTSALFKAAGYLEGYLTAHKIQQQICNIFNLKAFNFLTVTTKLDRTTRFLRKQDRWMRGMIAKHSETSAFWRHAGFVAAQLDGLLAGYRAAAIEETSLMPLDWTDFQLLNAFANLYDLNAII